MHNSQWFASSFKSSSDLCSKKAIPVVSPPQALQALAIRKQRNIIF